MKLSIKENIINFIKSPIKVILLLSLIVLTIIGIRIGHTNFMFYNFIFIPLIGVLIYLLYEEKYYYGLEIMGLIVFCYYLINSLMYDYSSFNLINIILSSLSTALIFIILSIIGSGVAHLYHKSITRSFNLVDRILAIISATGIILILASVTFSLHGNPLIHELAKGSAREYLDEKYSNYNLDIYNNYYDTKMDNYVVEVRDTNSKDINFEIYVDKAGNIIDDTYENVSSKFNTFLRISEEYEKGIVSILNLNELNIMNVFASYIVEDDNTFDKLKSSLTIDEDYDTNELGSLYGHITLFVSVDTISTLELTTYISELNEILEENNIKYNSLNISFTTSDEDIEINNLYYKDIISTDLTNIITSELEKTTK